MDFRAQLAKALQRHRSNFQGFKFTGPLQPQVMEGLAVAIQRREVSFPGGPVVSELEAFGYQYTRTGVT